MQKFIELSKRLINDDSGATALEYGLIAGLISVAIVAGATAAGSQASIIFSTIASDLSVAA